ncbi:MAG: RtcB family protein [Ekhidna sp.]|nr:RtcB family protein [Ekhidna sp.]
MKIIDGIPVFGEIQQNALDQMKMCAKTAHSCALMADHHKGYSQPIGGVVAYKDAISPSGVGYDIACGNKAVLLDVNADDIREDMNKIMDDVFSKISFGVGRSNAESVDHELFDLDSWDIVKSWQSKDLKQMAKAQLGTVGSGNHYVDIFEDEVGRVWVGVHFGSRGLGHHIATHYVKAAGGVDQIDAEPTIIPVGSSLGQEYLECMNLAGEYAYAGRDWVCQKVASIIGADIKDSVHNHHNFAWEEEHFGEKLWVVRKGATPAFPDQFGFVGGSMGENSVILKGCESVNSQNALYSTVHGAGRVMSRTEAAGRIKWKRGEDGKKRMVKVKDGKISTKMMRNWVDKAEVVLRGAGTDESPHCYKRLNDVLEAQGSTIEVVHTLKPMGVAMAGSDEYDPYKD